MGFKILCKSAVIRPASSVKDHNYLDQSVEVELDLCGGNAFEDLFYRIWELVDSDDLDKWMAGEGYKRQD